VRRRAAAGIVVPLALAGCAIRIRSGSDAAPLADDDAVPRIDVDAAYQEIQAGRAAIFDVRGPASYAARHAVGARLIPLDDIEQSPRSALALLPAGKRPIFYCT
jgi:hypothetical protein